MTDKNSFVICVDFDGTVVTHDYPRIGEPCPGALDTLFALDRANHRIILWTMRSGKELDDAVKYLEDNQIRLYGINQNPDQKSWSGSPKAYGHIYIDDAALGCPLHFLPNSKRPQVKWDEVELNLKGRGLI